MNTNKLKIPYRIKQSIIEKIYKCKYLHYSTLDLFHLDTPFINHSKTSQHIMKLGKHIEHNMKKIYQLPTYFYPYNMKSDCLNVSSLKTKKRLHKLLNIIIHDLKVPNEFSNDNSIKGMLIEKLIDTICKSNINLYKGKSKKLELKKLTVSNTISQFFLDYNIPEYIRGTVDYVTVLQDKKLNIQPIELKTIHSFSQLKDPNFLNKKMNNYLTQLILYENMYKKNIWLLLFSRHTFEFTILPLKYLKQFTTIQHNFETWISIFIKEFKNNQQEYKKLNVQSEK